MPYYDALPDDWLQPGETTVVEVDGFPIAVGNVDGEHFAFQHLCPHQGAALGGRPLVNGCEVVCPQHASRYDVRTGTCLEGAQGDGFSQDLMTFKVEVTENVVRVEF